MIAWVQMATQPIYTFYTTEAVKDIATLKGLIFRRLLSVGQIARPCSISGGSESANLMLTLDNGDGLLTGLFTDPPHRVQALVSGYHNGRLFELFRGVISRVAMASEIRISMEF